MIAGSLARRYARAVFAIGVEDGSYERLGREIAAVADAMRASDTLRDALTAPVFSRAQRRAVLEKVLERLGASRTTRNFCLLLIDRERIAALPDIARELAAMIDDKAGRVRAVVATAVPLPADVEQRLRAALEKASGKTVHMTKQVDPSLLGGVVAQLGDTRYDGSLRTQLDRMRQALVK
ncbi:MAG: F0F1 ATP synthase subunit delta [Deltaproteobacteria bacterium]|nr:MAG: F0F1 ATP synthase subunit delta [Deltaproteobacteria bacterium]